MAGNDNHLIPTLHDFLQVPIYTLTKCISSNLCIYKTHIKLYILFLFSQTIQFSTGTSIPLQSLVHVLFHNQFFSVIRNFPLNILVFLFCYLNSLLLIVSPRDLLHLVLLLFLATLWMLCFQIFKVNLHKESILYYNYIFLHLSLVGSNLKDSLLEVSFFFYNLKIHSH